MPRSALPAPWRRRLDRGLHALHDANLLRQLTPRDADGPTVRRHGRPLWNLASNDYLGLAGHPGLLEAVRLSADRAGAGASRLLGGTTAYVCDLERRLAAFKHAEAALILPTGYMANLAVLTALAGPGDRLCLDRAAHASLIDAARLSGAEVRTFHRERLAKLAALIQRPCRNPDGLKAIVTDSVFSMDGAVADLPALADLAETHGALLIVDEAHGTGLLGSTGSGLAEAQGVAHRVHLTISTASKAMGGLGGIVTGPEPAIQWLVNKARPFIYTTAPPPAQLAAIGAALDVIESEPQRRDRLARVAAELWAVQAELPWLVERRPVPAPVTPIVPLIVGDARRAQRLSAHLLAHGVDAPAIRPPTVPPGTARVRLSLRSDLPDEAIDAMVTALRRFELDA